MMEYLYTLGYIYVGIAIILSIAFYIMSFVSPRTTFMQCVGLGFAFPWFLWQVYKNIRHEKTPRKKH